MKSGMEVVTIETDVLVIGGGLAGCMAAIGAREHGARVTIAEKGNTMSSGQAGSGIDHIWAYIPDIHDRVGWSIDDLVDDHVQVVAGGFARRDLFRLMAEMSYARLLDLERFGLRMRYDDSPLTGGLRLVQQFGSIPETVNLDGRRLKVILTNAVKRSGATIVNRVTMTDLLTADSAIAGAVGIGTRDGKIYLFKAKGVVLATGGKTGRLGREPSGIDFNLHLPANLCCDGKAMAYQAGLPVMNMEFLSSSIFAVANYGFSAGLPRNTWHPAASVVDAQGRILVANTHLYPWDELKTGNKIDPAVSRRAWLAERNTLSGSMPKAGSWGERGPFYLDCTGASEEEIRYTEWSIGNEGRGAQFLRHLDEEGIDLRRDKLELSPHGHRREIGNMSCSGLLVDGNLEATIRGLFVAGDEIGGVPFASSMGAFTTGWHCGDVTGSEARTAEPFLPIDNDVFERRCRSCTEMLSRSKGAPWQEVNSALQNVMDDYCGEVRTEAMLVKGLDHLKAIKGIPLRAANPHELGRCLEVMFLLDAGEMVIRASLARKESRRQPLPFRRADFPEQDDKNWLAFSAVRLENGKPTVFGIPINAPL